MRYDRGVRIFTRTTTKIGEIVWVPLNDRWQVAVVVNLPAPGTIDPLWDCAEVDLVDDPGRLEMVRFWRLRQYHPNLTDKGKPDEPVPPRIGKPKQIGRCGFLTNGDIKGP